MIQVRQAVVVVHGMGEQLPLSTLTRFIDTALAPDESGARTYYSRPESTTGSFESRRFLAPARPDAREPTLNAQTDFFEYHWAAPCVLHYVKVPIDVAIGRATARVDPAAPTPSAADIRHLAVLFEPPSATEGFALHEVSWPGRT